MRQKSVPVKEPAAQVVKNIRRATRRHFSAEDTDVYFGRGQTILLQRERIKRQTIAQRRLQHQRQAA